MLRIILYLTFITCTCLPLKSKSAETPHASEVFLTAEQFLELSEGQQLVYLEKVGELLGQSHKSELFVNLWLQVIFTDSWAEALRFSSGSIDNRPLPKDFESTIEMLLSTGQKTYLEEKYQKQTVGLAKIYLNTGQRLYPKYDFSKIANQVTQRIELIKKQDENWDSGLNQALREGGDELINFAKSDWFEIQRGWRIHPGAQRIDRKTGEVYSSSQESPGILQKGFNKVLGKVPEKPFVNIPLRLLAPKDIEADLRQLKLEEDGKRKKEDLEQRGGRCLYAGFPIKGKVCRALSQMPEYLSPITPKDLMDVKCESPTPVLCNPFIFGCKLRKPNATIHPLCVIPNRNATRLCSQQSNIETRTCAVGIIKSNPSAWDKFRFQVSELCSDENLKANRFLTYHNDGITERNQQSKDKVKKDLEETCGLTLTLIKNLTQETLIILSSDRSSGRTKGAK